MILQAIETKYIGPSNKQGARVKATATAGSKIISWDYDLSQERNHERAAHELARKYGWNPRELAGGEFKNGRCFWVQIS